MAILLDKLSKLRPTGAPATTPQAQISPLPSITQTINQPPARSLTTTPMPQKIEALPQRGALGSMPQWKATPQRFLADLPAQTQLQGIQEILSGQDSNSPLVNNFVRTLAAQGKQPEEIRQAFIAQQKTSANPLVLA